MTNMAISALHEKVMEHLEAAHQALESLEESDRFWRGHLRTLEDRQSKSLGLNKADFDKLYYKAMGAVQLGNSHEPPSLSRFKVQLSTSVNSLRVQPPRPWSRAVFSSLATSSVRRNHATNTTTTSTTTSWSPLSLRLRPATSG